LDEGFAAAAEYVVEEEGGGEAEGVSGWPEMGGAPVALVAPAPETFGAAAATADLWRPWRKSRRVEWIAAARTWARGAL
jgi:hypothetical protein